MGAEPRLVRDLRFGFLRVEPIPDASELREHYRKYVSKSRQSGRAPDVRREASGETSEVRWLEATRWSDVLTGLEGLLPKQAPRRLLDVGAGTGAFASFARRHGWEVIGVEPSDELVAVAPPEASVHHATLEEFWEQRRELLGSFTAVTLLNVLEHMVDPVSTLVRIRDFLLPKGIICVCVPNDFSPMQQEALRKIGGKPWWVVIPDHVNYFSKESLTNVLEGTGFRILDWMADFPMELFLLMGEDYVHQPELGPRCHARRVEFELSITPELRRALYRALASVGIGRNLIAFAEVVSR